MTLHMVTAKHTHTHSQTRSINNLSHSLSVLQTQQDTLTHTFTKLSQYLTQLGNARGKAEVIIMSVFNSSVTGGCSFSVSKEHVNKQAELFKSENRLTHAGRPHTLSSSPSGIISGREGTKWEKKMSSVQVQIFDWAEPSRSFLLYTNANKFRIWWCTCKWPKSCVGGRTWGKEQRNWESGCDQMWRKGDAKQ